MRTTAAPFRNHVGFWALAFLSIVGAAACGSDDDHHDDEGTASGATCPAGNTLTYDNFGRDFMSKYCTKCHSSTVTGDARHGAPAGHDFDTLAGILAVADHIDEHAASGPNATNTEMPPEGETAPSKEEREKLGQWLACETEDDDGGSGDGGHDHGDGGGDTGTSGDGRSDSTQSDGGRGGG
jgi:uncharacterized membrane protein